MSARRLALLFAAAFAIALALFLPLRLGLALAGGLPAGISAQAVGGSVWRGRLDGVRLGGVPVGDLDVAASPWSLARGRFRVAGEALRAEIRRDGVHALSGTLPLVLLDPGLGRGGEVHFDRATLRFADGGCAEAGGRMALDVATLPPAALRLIGDLRCAGGDAEAVLRPETAPAPLQQLTLRLRADGSYLAEAVATPTDTGNRLALELLGFAPGPAGHVRTHEGRLLTGVSEEK
ncbi:type II secretion system protein N [Coralloluteibacterium thermophilus]|uniref:Type II secretion system protein N n=1 Tax=Coralloluteibacterium thermophilum TaxID=2707049 RepID=A0ABV9NKH6_9GAMM